MKRKISSAFLVLIMIFLSVFVYPIGANALTKEEVRKIRNKYSYNNFDFDKKYEHELLKNTEIEITDEDLANYNYVPYFGFYDSWDAYCSENYYQDKSNAKDCMNSMRASQKPEGYLISDYQDGVCINRYCGKGGKLVIPDKIDGKRVIKLGGCIYRRRYTEPELVGKKYYYEYYPCFTDCYYGCKTYSSITLPKYLKYIACGVLNFIDYYSGKGGVKKIYVHPDNEYYTSVNDMLFTKNKKVLLYVPSLYLEKVIKIPNGTKAAYSVSPFTSTKDAYTVSIPSSLINICGEYTTKKGNILHGPGTNDRVVKFKVSTKNKYYSSKDGVLYDKKQKILLSYPGAKTTKEFKVPNSVQEIYYMDCTEIKKLKVIKAGKNIKRFNVHVYFPGYPIKKITVKGYKGSVAHKWAKKNKIHDVKFIPLD